MTTYYPFVPSRRSVPQFAPTLDGEQYSCACVWSLFGQRYYLNCIDLSGNLIFSRPVVDAPPASVLNALTWSGLTGVVTATTETPHGYKIGSVVNLTVAGCLPGAYNGAFACVITGPSSFTYPINIDPGANSVAGSFSFMINLASGYFQTSTIIYRNQAFEVSP